MSYTIIYSRAFLEKVFSWQPHLQKMAFEAAEHAAQDPHNYDYHRGYLIPYKQKHPTADHQYTLYFLIVSANELFFAWINDQNCLHDTRANYQDPCLKEFQKLLAREQIEVFDQNFHQIKFEVHPDKAKPIRSRSKLLGSEIILNTYSSGLNNFVGHAFHCEEPNLEIAKIHVKYFLNEFHNILSSNRIDFEFNLYKQGHQHEIFLLSHCYDMGKWLIVDDPDDFIIRKI